MSSRTQLLTSSALRIDSRLPLELRALSFAILPSPPSTSHPFLASALPPGAADGHAAVAHGLTRVTASVYGPREPLRTGAFSGAGGGARGLDKAVVNVEIGVAGWSEKNVTATQGGVRRGGKDRCVLLVPKMCDPQCAGQRYRDSGTLADVKLFPDGQSS